MSRLLNRYQDRADYSDRGWTVTNEDPNIWREIALNCGSKILAITGGGEVPLLSLLPSGAKVAAIDRSYNSITATMAKTILLERHGSEMKTVLAKGETYFRGFVEREVELPEKIRYGPFGRISRSINWSYETFQNIWTSMPDYVLDSSKERIVNLNIIHGDINDPSLDISSYDALYLSNALIGFPQAMALKDGAYVMSSTIPEFGLRLVQDRRLQKDTWPYSRRHWNYCLYRVERQETAPATQTDESVSE